MAYRVHCYDAALLEFFKVLTASTDLNYAKGEPLTVHVAMELIADTKQLNYS